MTSKNDVLLKKLLITFRIEADAHLQTMASGLLALEKTPSAEQFALVETIFRAAHSLKGAARTVNHTDIEAVCRSLENAFSAMKEKHLVISPELIDLLLQGTDTVERLLAIDDGQKGALKPLIGALIRQINEALLRPLPEFSTAPEPVLPPSDDPPTDVDTREVSGAAPSRALATVRVSAEKLDTVMRQVEELLLPCLAVGHRAEELGHAFTTLAAWKKQRLQIQPVLRVVDRELTHTAANGNSSIRTHELPKLLKYLDAEQVQMKMLEDQLARLQRAAEQDQRMLTSLTDGLRQDVKEMQLLPFASLLQILPRFSRELARDQGKNLEMTIRGSELEIDRHILEEMKDPLIHLVRNCIDHGIEPTAVRVSKGKPPHGTITLACSQKDSSTVELLVTDDGAGFDLAMVKAAACKLGVILAEEAEQLGELEVAALAFKSGVTTSPIVTDISGRGLGLAIVHEKVEHLGGNIVIKSIPGAGTAFHISLPRTLANFRGLLVHAGEQLFVIPSTSVERVVRVPDKEIRTVENRTTILVDEQPISLVWLSDILELPRHSAPGEPTDSVTAVVLGSGLLRVAFLVEAIVGEQEVLAKALVRPLVRVRNIAGASVLGSGRMAPVLNPADLLKSAVKRPPAAQESARPIPSRKDEKAKKQSVLVVEDSITSRVLLKNILESGGYRVTTAVDGVDGFTTLKTGSFDLVVSDVEMPRMDGFGLTAQIRAEKKFAGLPVVLVTALESREHRERGIDAGANAYIVKSNFDQSNLLEVIRRLIGTSSALS
ncbi:hybrid sensor histidine kinase/response regulator [Nitrosospira sp. Is2]|uniref:hybrid sensor histidine kinase/response regulator n=1 Tax=Nitrosospira sp. Is2 TaxID=3080532 RepID=UPI002953AA62|nr:hybrid sensor histidine kinase/response regulator [Nitrosospira sp. Is2]WON73166.1 hybrid sensor histidine kinase/response regulator [Nitrosospira sp. Is2]